MRKFTEICFTLVFGLIGFFVGFFVSLSLGLHTHFDLFGPATVTGIIFASLAGFFLATPVASSSAKMFYLPTIGTIVALGIALYFFTKIMLHV